MTTRPHPSTDHEPAALRTQATARPDSPSARRPGLAATVASERIKFGAVPTHRRVTMLAVVLAFVLAVIFCISIPVTRGTGLSSLAPDQIASAALLGIDVAAIVLVVLGAGFVGHEYATGVAEQTFIATPHRQRVLTAKIVVVGVVSLVVGVVAALIGLAVGAGAVLVSGQDVGAMFTGKTLRLAAGSVLMPVVYAYLSVCGAFVFRSTTGGVLVPLALGILGGIFGWLPEAVAGVLIPLTPLAAVHNISGVAEPGSAEHMGVPLALVALTLWAAIPYLVARHLLLHRDA